MSFKIGQVEVRLFEVDLVRMHIRAAIYIPTKGGEIAIAGEYDKSSNMPLYLSVETKEVKDEED